MLASFSRRSRSRVALVVLCSALVTVAACTSASSKTASSTTTAANTATDSTAKISQCGTWQTQYVGEPKTSKDANQSGYFVWTDLGGWHLRVRDPKGVQKFTGTITSSKDLVSAKASPDGSGTVTLAANKITLDFKGTKDLTGFDFSPGCVAPADLQLKFELQTDGTPADPATIFTGANSKALGSSFTAERSKN